MKTLLLILSMWFFATALVAIAASYKGKKKNRMKVMCIDDRWNIINGRLTNPPQVGMIYEAIDCIYDRASDGEYFFLAGHDGYFETKAFAQVTEIDDDVVTRREPAVTLTRTYSHNRECVFM